MPILLNFYSSFLFQIEKFEIYFFFLGHLFLFPSGFDRTFYAFLWLFFETVNSTFRFGSSYTRTSTDASSFVGVVSLLNCLSILGSFLFHFFKQFVIGIFSFIFHIWNSICIPFFVIAYRRRLSNKKRISSVYISYHGVFKKKLAHGANFLRKWFWISLRSNNNNMFFWNFKTRFKLSFSSCFHPLF